MRAQREGGGRLPQRQHGGKGGGDTHTWKSAKSTLKVRKNTTVFIGKN